MSAPLLRQRDGGGAMIYAPRWLGPSPPAVPATAIEDDESTAIRAMRAGPNRWRPPPAATESPPMAPEVGGQIDPPRLPQFHGDVALKELRDQLSVDPDLEPQPPAVQAGRPALQWLGRWTVVLLLVAAAGFCIRWLTAPEEAGDAVGPVGVVTPSLGHGPLSAEPAIPRLVIRDRQGIANEPLTLGISLTREPRDEVVTIVGLTRGTRLTTGAPLEQSGWQVSARRLAGSLVEPPKDYVGVMEAAVELRSADDQLLDSQILRLEWRPGPEPAVKPAPALAPKPAPEWARAPAPERAQAPPGLSADEIAALIKRGEDFLKFGDVSSARIAFRRAAQAGNSQAALALGATYDPKLLAEHGVIGFSSDAEQARSWYARAAGLGSAEAARRLERLSGM